MREYQRVREAEGRGSIDGAYYRALPFADLSGRFTTDWQIRARSFRAFAASVLQPRERESEPAAARSRSGRGEWLAVLSAGAARPRARRRSICSTNPQDGLGAYVHYDAAFTPVQAEFDRLPFDNAQFDLAIFNASLHYADQLRNDLARSAARAATRRADRRA